MFDDRANHLDLTRQIEAGIQLPVAVIHQRCQPMSGLNRGDAAISQGITDHSMQRVIPMIKSHAFIQRHEIIRVAASPQIIDHTVLKVDSHRSTSASQHHLASQHFLLTKVNSNPCRMDASCPSIEG
tara:strand:+ start:28 stop:408 length:381 start_codon:yes stop_codon:yes gene_type:complete